MESVTRVQAFYILPYPPPADTPRAPADAGVCAEGAGNRYILHLVERDYAPAPRRVAVFEGVDEQQCDNPCGEEGSGSGSDAAGVEGGDQAGGELFVVLGERGEGCGEVEGGGYEG